MRAWLPHQAPWPWAVAALLILHAAVVAWQAAGNSPTMDEVGHLPAGMWVWKTLRFDVYRVNPPLVRTLAAAPVVLANPQLSWKSYSDAKPHDRPEWALGRDLIAANDRGDGRWAWYFILARWACIPLSLIGACVCYRWAADLYGPWSGLLALALWCLCPNITAWATTICPDLGATALGVAASYVFWRWLRNPNWFWAFTSGLVLGLAELTKTTWIVLFALWPVLWMLWNLKAPPLERRRSALQLAAILLLAVYAINAGYVFDGSLRRLGDYTFVSRTLAGPQPETETRPVGNRFAESWLGALPVPLPKDYLSGIDLQKLDFEEGKQSYLCGQWKHGGWWYYYLFVATIKVPLGVWVIALVAVALTAAGACGTVPDPSATRATPSSAYSAGWRNELTLLAPALVVFVLVSSQTGFSRYFRYVLPCFPFAFIWISKVARSMTLGHRSITWLVGAALCWAAISAAAVYPHSMSYFNELAGGPTNGHRYVVDANIDWGQDLFYLKRWLDAHPEARPLGMAYLSFIHPEHFGIKHRPPPEGPPEGVDLSRSPGKLESLGPRPGWYAMSIHRIHSNSQNYLYFLRFQPVARAGYSIYLYHITLEDANRVRRELGLPELPPSAIEESRDEWLF